MIKEIHRGKRHYELDGDHRDDVCFRIANLTAKCLNMSDCYVCSFIPHHSQTNPCFIPKPVPLEEVVCFIAMYTALTTTPTNFMQFTQFLPNCTTVTDYNLLHWRTPDNFSTKTNVTNLQGITMARNPIPPSLCFRRDCAGGDVDQGVANCVSYFPVEGTSSHPPCSGSKSKASWVKPIKFTEVGIHSKMKGWVSEPVMNKMVPHAGGFSCPIDHVWVCGHKVYLYLPQGWSRVCYLAKLQPAAFVIPKSCE